MWKSNLQRIPFDSSPQRRKERKGKTGNDNEGGAGVDNYRNLLLSSGRDILIGSRITTV
jgi:hypothetical protein